MKNFQERSVEDQLIRASVVGDLKTVVSLLQLGVDPNYRDKVTHLIHCILDALHRSIIFNCAQNPIIMSSV